MADAARYTGLASEKFNLYGSTAWTRATQPLSRGQMAEAVRYAAVADAARWTALAIHHGKRPESISAGLAAVLGE